MKKTVMGIIMILFVVVVLASQTGAVKAMEQSQFSLEEMLQYAIEDEHKALASYKITMEKFNISRPYSNIAESERSHIRYLTELYDWYDLVIPEVDAGNLPIPKSLSEAAEICVEGEIVNIAMYDKFLANELPADVEEVFITLRNASKNHLRAFQRQLDTEFRQGGNWRGRRF